MADSIGAVRIDIIGNADDFKLEVQKAKTLVQSMGPEFKQSFDKMEPAAQRATLAALKFEQQIGKSKDELRLLSLAARGAAPEALEVVRRKMLETRDAAAQATTVMHGQTKAFSGSSKTARELQFAMRGLPAQLTDIGVSLASGQRPMMVLLQQGGQLKDMFGGIRPAAAAMATAIRGLINPLTLAAGAVGLLTLAWKDAANEADAFNKALILTGNFAGTSTEELEAMGDRLASSTSATVGAAREAVTQVAATGRFTKEQIESVARAALEMKEATGQAVDETIQAFVRIADDPVRAIETLNKSQHLLDESTLKQVKSLKEQGKEAEAAALAIRSVVDETVNRADKVERSLSVWGTAWNDVGKLSKGAWDEIIRGITGADAAAASAKSLVQLLTMFNPTLGAMAGGWGASIDARMGSQGQFGNVQSRATTKPADPTDQILADIAVLESEVYGPAEIAANNARAEAWAKAGAAAKKALNGQETAAKRAARELQALAREEASLEQALLKQEDAKSRAIESWAELRAELDGPTALALFKHKQNLFNIAAAGKAAGASADEIVDAQKKATLAFEQSGQAVLEATNYMEVYSDEAARNMQDAFADFLFDPFKDGLNGMLEGLADTLRKMVAQVAASRILQTMGLLGGGTLGGESAGTIFDLFSGSGFGFAKGGVFANSPSLSAYSGGVYDKPQLFKFASGAGIFGEAGPEAIIPLKRGRDGKLGVESSLGEVNVNIFNAPAGATVNKRSNDSGGFDIDVIFKQIEGGIAGNIANGASPVLSALKGRTNVREMV